MAPHAAVGDSKRITASTHFDQTPNALGHKKLPFPKQRKYKGKAEAWKRGCEQDKKVALHRGGRFRRERQGVELVSM